MSWETQSWAAKQRPGSASAKLVLLGLASCADANHCAFPSIQWLCDFSDLNRKTVIAALQRLEDGMFPLIEDTGDRRGRTGQVKVYRLAAAASGASSDPASETVPKTEQFQKRNSSVFSVKQSQKRDTEPFREPFPLSPPDGGDTPRAVFASGQEEETAKRGRKLGSRLPADWSPPDAASLPPVAAALVAQWPDGAYAAVCEGFRLHWLAETRAIGRKADWRATLGKWCITEHASVMRAAKAGVSYAAAAPIRPAPASPQRAPPVRAKAQEDAVSAALHKELEGALGEYSYAHWIKGAALLMRGDELHIILPSRFAASYAEANLQAVLFNAAAAVRVGVRILKFEVGKVAA